MNVCKIFYYIIIYQKKLPCLKTDNFGYAALPHPQNHHPRSETFSMFMPETQLLKKKKNDKIKNYSVAPWSLWKVCIRVPPSGHQAGEEKRKRDKSRQTSVMSFHTAKVQGRYLFQSDGEPSVRHKLDFHLLFFLLRRKKDKIFTNFLPKEVLEYFFF